MFVYSISQHFRLHCAPQSNVCFQRWWGAGVSDWWADPGADPWQLQCRLSLDRCCCCRHPHRQFEAPRCGSQCFSVCGTSRLSGWGRRSTPLAASTGRRRCVSNQDGQRMLWSGIRKKISTFPMYIDGSLSVPVLVLD